MNNCSFPGCGTLVSSIQGMKRHWSMAHPERGYTDEDIRAAGFSPSATNVARDLDDGNTSIDDVVASAPVSESTDTQPEIGKRKGSKRSREDASEEAKLAKLRPVLVSSWQRRLTLEAVIICRFTGEPMPPLEELKIGAEMHADMIIALGWSAASKFMAFLDCVMWHGQLIMLRLPGGKEFLTNMISSQPEQGKPN